MSQTLSTKALLKSTLLAIVVAAITLVTVILPAEYNIDPTGIGQTLGLTVFNQTASTNTDLTTATEQLSDTIDIIVPAGRGVEFKFYMQQFKKMNYQWQTDGQPLYFDLHGEPEGDTTGYFESYAIATLNKMEGSYTTPFAGAHGWYWKNKSTQDITIQLTVTGDYRVIGLKQ